MKVELEVRVVNPVESGISSTTGKAWKAQNIVLACTEPHWDGTPGKMMDQLFVTRLFNDTVDQFNAINAQVGSLIQADMEFQTKKFGNSIGQEIHLHNIVRANV